MVDFSPLRYLANDPNKPYDPLGAMNPLTNSLASLAYRGFMAPGQALASTQPMTSEQMIAPAQAMQSLMMGGAPMAERGAVGVLGGRPLAIKEAIAAASPAEDMVRLYRGGGNNPGGPKWVTTDRRYAERYTTPGLAHTEGPGSFLQYVDIPKTDPRVQMPAGQSVHSFEAPPDIADRLQPFYKAR
jgi:hypothetical protein